MKPRQKSSPVNRIQSHQAARAIAFAFAISTALTPLHAELSKETFLDPPLKARPSALWTWMNAHVDRDQLTFELEEMKDKGMRGAIIWDMGALIDPDKIIPHGPPFLGPESVASIHHVIDEADRLGLEMGISAASSWNAGGPWVSPSDGCQTVAWASLSIAGPKDISIQLPLPEKAKQPTTTLAVIAVPAAMDVINPEQAIWLDDHLDANDKLTWSAPKGDWKIFHFVSTATGQQLMCPSPNSRGLMVDHLSAAAARSHFDHFMDAIIGDREDLGSLKTLFLDSYEVKTPVDWTPEFTGTFQKTYGYDPLPWLPVLTGMTVGNEDLSDRFRHDYGKMVSDLTIGNHYTLARSMANEKGLQLLAEAGHGGYAKLDTLKALGAVDVPMGEYWNHRKNWCVKEASSAANLYGKTLVNAEAMTGWQHWQDGPEMYKRLTDIAFCAGLNQITFHTFAHQPPGAGLPGYAYHAGEHFNVNLTWWPQARPLLDTLSRSCHMLQQGRQVVDVIAYYGDGAPNLVPARRITPTIEPRWTEDKCLHCGRDHPVDLSTLGQGHDYDYLNEEILVDKMQVCDGRLTLPNGMEYRLLVIPDRETISLTVLEKIGRLVSEGATVVGPKPLRSNSMENYPENDLQVRELADEIWDDCDGETVRSRPYGQGKVFWNVPLDKILRAMEVAPDFTVEGIENSGRKIDFVHRTTGDEEIYFVCNTSEETLSFTGEFRVGDTYTPHIWNPEDGSAAPCLLHESFPSLTRIPMTLAPSESRFVVFSPRPAGKRPAHVTALEYRSAEGSTRDIANADVVSVADGGVAMQIKQNGLYSVATSDGAKGSILIEQIPPARALEGPWMLKFEPDRGAPTEAEMETLTDWTQHSDPSIRYFSGTATYHRNFTVGQATMARIARGHRVRLNLGEVHEIAVVTLNGKKIATLWKPPYSVDVSGHLKAEENTLSIAVTNVWNNRIVGDLQNDNDTEITRTNLREKFRADSPLKASGMIGPVLLEESVPAIVELNN